jgi:hypothetical protein
MNEVPNGIAEKSTTPSFPYSTKQSSFSTLHHATNELELVVDACKEEDKEDQRHINHSILLLLALICDQASTSASHDYLLSVTGRLLKGIPLTQVLSLR